LLSNKLKAFSAFYYSFAAAAYTLTFARCRLSPFGLSTMNVEESKGAGAAARAAPLAAGSAALGGPAAPAC